MKTLGLEFQEINQLNDFYKSIDKFKIQHILRLSGIHMYSCHDELGRSPEYLYEYIKFLGDEEDLTLMKTIAATIGIKIYEFATTKTK